MNYGPDRQHSLQNGKDRSSFTVYSLLRLEYGFADEAARAALETRLGTRGQYIANVDLGQECNQAWLEKALRRS